MKNFLRALRCAWPYRGRLILSIVCALLAAVFWGLNFTAIYPVLKIIGSNNNLQQWGDNEIRRTQKEIDRLEPQTQDLKKKKEIIQQWPVSRQRDNAERRNTSELARVESRLESVRSEQYRFQLMKYYIDLLLPTDCFMTLVVIL